MWTRTLLMTFALAAFAVSAAEAASAPVTFGAKLDIHTQPSNAGRGIFCTTSNQRPDCSWVLMQAFQCEFGSCKNGHLAPQDGTLASVSLIACFPGSFVLQIGKANPQTQQAQIFESGPLITYQGDPRHCNGNRFQIETFPVNVPVQKGDYLAVATQKLGFVRCSGGGNNMLLFDPPLPDGGPLRTANDGDGCFMLLEATYAPAAAE